MSLMSLIHFEQHRWSGTGSEHTVKYWLPLVNHIPQIFLALPMDIPWQPATGQVIVISVGSFPMSTLIPRIFSVFVPDKCLFIYHNVVSLHLLVFRLTEKIWGNMSIFLDSSQNSLTSPPSFPDTLIFHDISEYSGSLGIIKYCKEVIKLQHCRQ